MNDLTQQKCVPCEGGVEPLKKAEIEKYLPLVPGWQLVDNTIVRELKFKNFRETMEFVNVIGLEAEEQGHHPDIFLYNWNHVRLTLFTHAIGGLHNNDFIMAAKIDKILNDITPKS